MGKTTLLAQAVAENRLVPRGEDVWIGLEEGDANGVVLARDVMAAVSAAGRDRAAGMVPGTTTEAPDPATVADAVWRRAPTAVCLVVDDVHCLAPGSRGATWLTALVDALPTSGHVLLASRWSPAVPLARLATQSAVLRVAEHDLRFSDNELAEFAARRGIAIERFDDTGGWPAMAELVASVGHDLAGDYLWEEVVGPLGPERRRVLAVLSDLGGADDGLAGAALGAPVDLARVLDGVPLVAHGAGGWRAPHQLWHGGTTLTLAKDERVATRRRAVDQMVAEHRYDEAMTLAREAGLVDLMPGILRAACIGADRPPGRQLERWLADLPDAKRATPTVSWGPSRCSARWPGGGPTSGCSPGCCPGWSSSRPRGIPSPGPWPSSVKRSSPTSSATTTMCSPILTPSSRGYSTTRGKRWPPGCAAPRWPGAAVPRNRSRSSMPSPRSPTRRSSSISRAPASRRAGRWARSTR